MSRLMVTPDLTNYKRVYVTNDVSRVLKYPIS